MKKRSKTLRGDCIPERIESIQCEECLEIIYPKAIPFIIRCKRTSRGYWKPNAQGYTTILSRAGRFTSDQIFGITKRCKRCDITIQISPEWESRKCGCGFNLELHKFKTSDIDEHITELLSDTIGRCPKCNYPAYNYDFHFPNNTWYCPDEECQCEVKFSDIYSENPQFEVIE